MTQPERLAAPESDTPKTAGIATSLLRPGARARLTLRGLLWPLGLLTAGLVAIIFLLLIFAAGEQNELAREASKHLGVSALHTKLGDLESQARDYAYWNDAVRNLVLTLDEDWIDDNIGIWAYEGLQMAATLVFDGQGQVIYAMADGELQDASLVARVEGLAPLVAAARAADPGDVGIAVSGYVDFDGGIALAAAAPIAWQDGRAAPDRGGAPSVLVYLRRLDDDALATLEQSFLLTGLHLDRLAAAAGAAASDDTVDNHVDLVSITLSTYDGQALARFAWTAEQPGLSIMRPLLLPGAIAAVAGLLLLSIVIRRSSRTIAELKVSHTALQQQANALAAARDHAVQQSHTEAELRHNAVAASRAKSEFLALVSHELRTPLNAILGFSETIATQAFGEGVSGRYREYANDIHESGSHLLSIINDILDLSKVEAGRYELHEDDVDLGALQQRCVALLRERAAAKNLALLCPDSDILLRADPRALKQIVFNLLTNAIKFTNSGGKVELRAFLTADTITVAVSDTGIGMSEDDLARALQPFGQAASALTRSVEGTGLGLNVTQALAALHGGRLVIHSVPGNGTTVEVRLPRTRLLRSIEADTSAASA